MVEGWLWWFAIAGPVGGVLVVTGLLGRRSGRSGFGNIFVGWGILGVVAPPLITFVTWLIAGNSAPRGGHEPWPFTASAAFLSVLFVLFATPIVVGVGVLGALAAPPRSDS